MERQSSFPSKDGLFNGYVNTVVPYLSAIPNQKRLGVSDANKAAAILALADWNNWYPQSIDANTRTKTITGHKKAARLTLTNVLRTIYDDIPQSALTLEDRNTLRLPERAAPHDAPIPETAPLLKIGTDNPFEHEISFIDSENPTSRAKPDGVYACGLYYSEVENADPETLIFIAMDTESPYLKVWAASFGKKNIYYRGRWVNSRGEHGPWSEEAKGTVTE